MPGTAQIFPVVGSGVTFPNPLPTQDAADGTPGAASPTLALQVAGSDGTDLRAIATDAAGQVKVLLENSIPAGTNVIGHVITDATSVTLATTNADTAIGGTSAPTKELLVAGKTNDGTPQYQPIPEGAGGRSVIVEGFAGGTPIAANPATSNTTTGDTPTIITATTFNGATQTNASARGAIITAILGTVSGTLPTLSLQLQWSPDGGTTWLSFGSATSAIAIATGNDIVVFVYPTALTLTLGGAGSVQTNAPLPRTWRMTYITTGTGISVAVASVQVNYCI